MGSAARNESYFTLIESDDGVLLDFDDYSSRKSRCCPSPPRWWYRLSTRQRGIARGFLWGALVVTAIGVVVYRVTGGSVDSATAQSPRSSPVPDVRPGHDVGDSSWATSTPPEPPPLETSPYTEPSTNTPGTDPATEWVQATPVYDDYTEAMPVYEEVSHRDGEATTAASPPPPPTHSTAFPRCTWGNYRLPTTTKPFLYDISLQLDPSLSHYNGSVRIALSLEEPTPCIVLHADNSLSLEVDPLETADGTVPGARALLCHAWSHAFLPAAHPACMSYTAWTREHLTGHLPPAWRVPRRVPPAVSASGVPWPHCWTKAHHASPRCWTPRQAGLT